jgi:oligopeptide/dipeptide ABC transporter ATP-binding protein
MSAIASESPTGGITSSDAPLVEFRGLSIGFPGGVDGPLTAVRDLDLIVHQGQTLGIVGESGCGKSLTLRSLLGIVPDPGWIMAGSILWRGEADLVTDQKVLRELRGREISMIFQDPLESLNPVFSIGDQLIEVLRKRRGLPRRDARQEAVGLLDRVGIPSAAKRLRDFPHQLSGGMRQRVMIAIALACRPAVLLADEPTTALDVTVQDQILRLISDLQRDSGLTIVLVSHDLGVVAQMADRVAVMYAGRIVETGTIDEVLDSPRHPYTAALVASAPGAVGVSRTKFSTIGGSPPTLRDLPETGCAFAPRCPFADAECDSVPMMLEPRNGSHKSACPVVRADSMERTGHAE